MSDPNESQEPLNIEEFRFLVPGAGDDLILCPYTSSGAPQSNWWSVAYTIDENSLVEGLHLQWYYQPLISYTQDSSNIVYAGAGNDFVLGGAGDDYIEAGSGDDGCWGVAA